MLQYSFKHIRSYLIDVSLEQVSVTPAPSSEYTLIPLSGDQYSPCLCANERKTFRWNMIPSVLGEA